MPGKWDSSLKQLLGENPEDFIRWLLPEAEYKGSVKARAPELNDRETTREIIADSLYEVIVLDVVCLLHIEFQSSYDARMAHRMWEYNALASFTYEKPTISFLIYLKPCTVAEPFYEWKMPTGRVIHHFDYTIIKMWEYTPQDIKATGLIGLYPLLFLTKGGKDEMVMDDVITTLQYSGKKPHKELLALSYMIASLVSENEDEREIVKRRFLMLEDILRETWAYQEILREGRQEGRKEGLKEGLQEGLHEGLQQGLQQGLEQGLQQGQLTALRETIVEIVIDRFPALTELANEKLDGVKRPSILRNLILKLSSAQTSEEAQRFLSDVQPDAG